MDKKNLVILSSVSLIGILALILMSFYLINNIFINDSQMRLGYCPTMKYFAEKLVSENQNLVLVELASSEQVLESLKSNSIDVALIGRMAKESEIVFAEEKVLGEGYTLVKKGGKVFVNHEDLENIFIYTAVDKSIAKNMLPEPEIIFFNTTEHALTFISENYVLIDWKDYTDDLDLVVVMRDGHKDASFRIPVLYSTKYSLENFELLI